MLTYPANYESALNSPFQENWLFQLHSDDTGNNFIPLAFNDTTVGSVFYYGAVINNPSIRESIDLKSSKAKTTNLSISIPNFNYNGSDISTYLLNTGGSTHYLNRPFKIYSQLNNASSLSDCLQVFNGRLRYVSFSGNKLQLQVVSERPWDNIDVPNIFSDNNIPVPVVYGDYTGNTTSNLTDSKKLYPAPLRSSAGNISYFLTANQSAETANACFYDKSSDFFPHLSQNAQTGSLSVFSDAKYGIGIDRQLIRTFRIRPIGIVSATDFSNTDRAIDTDKTTYAEDSFTASTTSSTRLRVQLPKISGKVTSANMYLKADLIYTNVNASGDAEARLSDDSTGTSSQILVNDSSGSTVSTSGAADSSGSGTDYSQVSMTLTNNELPDEIKLELEYIVDGTGTGTVEAKIYDIYVVIVSQNDYGNEPVASAAELGEAEKVYIGSDGLTKSWSSGTITKIHEAHRDIIHRFTGWGVDGSTYTTPENWSSGLNIDSERTDWKIRHWILEPMPLKTVLEKLQYEGGFISRFRADASFQYIVIPSSPSAAVTLTSSDISKLDVAHVPFDEIITKMHIQWDKHPAKNVYLNDVTLTNGGNNTLRTRLNITNDKENVKEVKLDAYVDDSSAQRFFDYYDGILGDLFIKISGEIVNPAYYKLEVGDQIAIDSNFPYGPFGESWSGKVFMITSTQRAAHKMRFAARQIN
tara:strand:- start:6422 stop:8515 length:2094 start_codon:yes stop_codon:yes gene_type:complete